MQVRKSNYLDDSVLSVSGEMLISLSSLKNHLLAILFNNKYELQSAAVGVVLRQDILLCFRSHPDTIVNISVERQRNAEMLWGQICEHCLS